jgi:ABC-type bacteriocin/lantibiotic exporter with double-glycine peptidase domain
MLLRSTGLIIISLILLVNISPTLTGIALGAIIPIVLTIVCFARFIKKKQIEIQDKKSDLGMVSAEAISNIRTVKSFANEQAELEKF